MTVDPIDELMREYHQGYAAANDPKSFMGIGTSVMTDRPKPDAEKVAEARAKIDAFLADRKDGETPNEFYRRLDKWIDENATPPLAHSVTMGCKLLSPRDLG